MAAGGGESAASCIGGTTRAVVFDTSHLSSGWLKELASAKVAWRTARPACPQLDKAREGACWQGGEGDGSWSWQRWQYKPSWNGQKGYLAVRVCALILHEICTSYVLGFNGKTTFPGQYLGI